MPWPSVCLAGYRMRRGQQLRGREWNGAAEQRLWGAWHGEGVGSGSALAEVTQWHQRKDNAVAEGVGACELQTSAVTGSRRQGG